jgi:hypothetical protein
MPSPLIVIGEDPVSLVGFIDGSHELQIKHGTNSLASYDQTLHAKHADLSQPSETIRIKLNDFTHASATWQINATHVSGGNTITWSRDTGIAYYDFGAMTDLLEVEATATSNSSPPQTKTRRFWVKTMPTDGLPDEP